MTYEKVMGIDHYIADDGKCFIIGGEFETIITELWLSNSDSIENYTEIEIPQTYPDSTDL